MVTLQSLLPIDATLIRGWYRSGRTDYSFRSRYAAHIPDSVMSESPANPIMYWGGCSDRTDVLPDRPSAFKAVLVGGVATCAHVAYASKERSAKALVASGQ